MPNSRVRPLTENASTPADTYDCNGQGDDGEAAEDDVVQAIRSQDFGAHVFEGAGCSTGWSVEMS